MTTIVIAVLEDQEINYEYHFSVKNNDEIPLIIVENLDKLYRIFQGFYNCNDAIGGQIYNEINSLHKKYPTYRYIKDIPEINLDLEKIINGIAATDFSREFWCYDNNTRFYIKLYRAEIKSSVIQEIVYQDLNVVNNKKIT